MYKIFTIILFILCSTFLLQNKVLADATSFSANEYGQLPAISRVQLSPHGDKFAFLQNYQGQLLLTVVNLNTQKIDRILKTDNYDVILNWYRWANNDVLIISAGNIVRQRTIRYTTSRLLKYEIGKDKKAVPLIKPRGRKELNAQYQDGVISMLPEQPDKILVQVAFDEHNLPSVYLVDVRTTGRKRIQRDMRQIEGFVADQQGNLRIAYGVRDTEAFYRFYNKNTEKWEKKYKFDVFGEDRLEFLGFDKDPNILFFKSFHNGFKSLFKMDLSHAEPKKELIYHDPKYDMDGDLIYSNKTGKVVGFSHSNLDDTVHYWDPELNKLQRSINHALPDAINSIIDMSQDGERYILFTSSKTDPGSYLLGNTKQKSLDFIGERYSKNIVTNYIGKQYVSFKARDDLTIKGYVTYPREYDESKQYPAIILPHGGPLSRDYAGFDYWSEFFANNGYFVFQPNFRGSSGYGFEFENASLGKWGQEMQDDIQDAAHWLIENTTVDKNKIGIAGGSYGGYAALMAVIKHPETFKVAASFAGVSDLLDVYKKSRYFTHRKIVRKQIGSDTDNLKRYSPVYQAEHVKRPVLLIHGSEDNIVPAKQSRDMAEELEDENKRVRYVELDEGNHWLTYQPHRIKTLEEMLNFFNKHFKAHTD